MSVQPHVALHFNPRDLNPEDLAQATPKLLGTPAQAIEAAIASARAATVVQAKEQLRKVPEVTRTTVLEILTSVWHLNTARYFTKSIGPVFAEAYLDAYRKVNAGDVPVSVVYLMAEQHAQRVAEYFHTTSSQALIDGFQAMLNRQVPPRVAADKVLDAYGLTGRQMSGYVARLPQKKISSITPLRLKAQALDYIARSLKVRFKQFTKQEEHNLKEQAQQMAWLYLQNIGKLPGNAEKVWITAKDERVCKMCGPLHGKKVPVSEQFVLPDGIALWTPGVHPNCRCEVRLIENRFSIQKDLHGPALAEFNDDHPRARDGRFSTKVRTRTTTAEDKAAQAQAALTAQRDRLDAMLQAAPLQAAPLTATPALGAAGTALGAQALEAVGLSAPQLNAVALDAPVLRGMALHAPALTPQQVEATVAQQAHATVLNEVANQVAAPPVTAVPIGEDIFITGDNDLGIPENGIIEFTPEQQWTGNRDEVAAQAYEKVHRQVRQYLDDVEAAHFAGYTGDGEEYYEIKDKSGRTAVFRKTQFEQGVMDIVWGGVHDDYAAKVWSSPIGEHDIEYYDSTESLAHLRDALNISQEKFQQTVYTTRHGIQHRVAPTDEGSKYGLNTWKNYGRFEVYADTEDPELRKPDPTTGETGLIRWVTLMPRED